jgi:diguanylate cyclase (GGDEF)-like protein
MAAGVNPVQAAPGTAATALAAMLQRLFAAESLDDVRRAVAHGAHVLAPYETVTIREFLPEGALEATLRHGANLGFEAKAIERHLRRLAVATGRTMTTLERFDEDENEALAASYRLHAGLCLVRPLFAYGKPVGVICFHFAQRTTLLDSEFDSLRKFCDSAGVALYNARVRAGLHDLAYTDPLTGLANRRRLEDEFDNLAGTATSIVLIDFDGLKQVNDTLDYERGDALISLIGTALRDTLRPGELAARLGGDEFVIVLPDTPEPTARTRAHEIETVLDSLDVPEDIRPYFHGASTAWATPTTAESLHAALRRATTYLHARKRRRRGDPPPPPDYPYGTR